MKHAFGIGSIIASLASTTLYHAFFFSTVVLKKPDNVMLSAHFANNVTFLLKHKEKADAPSVTLAIQTLRNTILVAIFIGGYAFQNATSAISLCVNSTAIDSKVSAGIVALLMFLSFLCWATVIRAAAHLGYHIGTLSYLNAEKPKLKSAENIESGPGDDIENSATNALSLQLKSCEKLMNYVTTCFRYF